MTTLFSATLTAAPKVHRGVAASAVLWITQVAVAGMLLMAGMMKLGGAAEMVAMFDLLGGQWFRYVTGVIEVAGAVTLLVPALAPFGALLLLAPTMIGAIATHLFIIGGSPAVPALLLAASLAIAWARRDQFAAIVSNQH